MSVLRGILKEEEGRLKSLSKMYALEIGKCPKGCISKKRIRNREYAYLAYRDRGRVRFEYLGPSVSKEVQELSAKVKERRKLTSLLKKAKQNLREVERMLRVRPA